MEILDLIRHDDCRTVARGEREPVDTDRPPAAPFGYCGNIPWASEVDDASVLKASGVSVE